MQPRTLVPLILPTPLNRITITEPCDPRLGEHFVRARAAGYTGWDIETNVTDDFWNRRIRTCQFGNGKEQYVVDLLALCDGDAELLYNAQGNYGKNLHLAPKLLAFVNFVENVVCAGDITKVGVNLGFEYGCWYWSFGRRAWKFWDCSMVEKVIYAGALPLKRYVLFSMEEMVPRYMGFQIDKTLQTSFNLADQLSEEQADYACLDVVLPCVLKAIQQLVLNGRTAKNNTNPANAKYLNFLDPIITGDDLNSAARIENECIGAFVDMHLHGERIDVPRWKKRIAKKKLRFAEVLTGLDDFFIPIVGKRTDVVTDEDMEKAKAAWKVYAVEGPEEKALKSISKYEMMLRREIAAAKKHGMPTQTLETEKEHISILRGQQREKLKDKRVAMKEPLKKAASDLGKKRTRIKKLAAKCEGMALIHYKSNPQLLAQLKLIKGLKALKKLDDEVLELYSPSHPVMKLIHEYHKLSKEIGTYGDQWANTWVTHPCKEEGWLHPGDGRLHCVFNQFHAETGRSSSEKPNGQNLPQDFDVRACFITDPPDESVRICREHQVECEWRGDAVCSCPVCGVIPFEATDPEELVMVTCDMSGAELRIIAELAKDPIWIGCFERGEDVHSVGTELLQGAKWTAATFHGGEIYYEKDKDGNDVEKIGKPCAYYAINPATGNPAHVKCKCPGHNKLRNGTKAINFLLAYGGGPTTLAAALECSVDEAKALMALHEATFPLIWKYLEESGHAAKMNKKAFDLFGGRRLFPKPTRERAIERCVEKDLERKEDGRLLLKEWEREKNIAAHIAKHGKKPDKQTLYDITHRRPTEKEINNSYMALHGNIERQGKNHAIQGSNARIAKIAMGCGHSPDGQPYLWHTLRLFKARLIKFVHDELVIICPKRFSGQVEALIKDAYKRAAAERMKLVIMESEAKSSTFWEK
jgi:DNA polymerase I-like protein with 3'-5' exonuclease and polymerase domains